MIEAGIHVKQFCRISGKPGVANIRQGMSAIAATESMKRINSNL
jgi:hypothetical protein